MSRRWAKSQPPRDVYVFEQKGQLGSEPSPMSICSKIPECWICLDTRPKWPSSLYKDYIFSAGTRLNSLYDSSRFIIHFNLPLDPFLILPLLSFVFDWCILLEKGNFQFSLYFGAPSYCFPLPLCYFILFYFLIDAQIFMVYVQYIVWTSTYDISRWFETPYSHWTVSSCCHFFKSQNGLSISFPVISMVRAVGLRDEPVWRRLHIPFAHPLTVQHIAPINHGPDSNLYPLE